MAKGRVGVLEAHEAPNSVAPQTHCGRAIAEYLLRQNYARKIGKRLIQMVRGQAALAIKHAKLVRDQAQKRIEILVMFWDGPMGIGNLLPFARGAVGNWTAPEKLHYETPMAGHRTCFARHRRHIIRVSGKSQFPIAAIA